MYWLKLILREKFKLKYDDNCCVVLKKIWVIRGLWGLIVYILEIMVIYYIKKFYLMMKNFFNLINVVKKKIFFFF